jgi:hypothetical protein
MELGSHSGPPIPAHVTYGRVDERLSVNAGNAHRVRLQPLYILPNRRHHITFLTFSVPAQTSQGKGVV